MSLIKYKYDAEDAIPEGYAALYTEQGEDWVLTGVEGIKTPKDVTKLQTSLKAERTAHKATKTRLSAFGELTAEDVHAKLDRFEELEAAAGGTLDDAKLAEMVEKRVTGTLKAKTAPLERRIAELETENGGLTETNKGLSAKDATRTREDFLRPLLVDAKVRQEHHGDVFMYAATHLEPTEDGTFAVRDGASLGVTVGLDAKGWLGEMIEKRPGWVPGSVGGGSRPGSGSPTGDNPWAKGGTVTAQHAFIKEHGMEKATQMAGLAKTSVIPTPVAQPSRLG